MDNFGKNCSNNENGERLLKKHTHIKFGLDKYILETSNVVETPERNEDHCARENRKKQMRHKLIIWSDMKHTDI